MFQTNAAETKKHDRSQQLWADPLEVLRRATRQALDESNTFAHLGADEFPWEIGIGLRNKRGGQRDCSREFALRNSRCPSSVQKGVSCKQVKKVGDFLKGSTGTPLRHPAPVAAIFNIFPHVLPFLAPSEGTTTDDTGLLGKVLFFDAFHDPLVLGSDGDARVFIFRSESR